MWELPAVLATWVLTTSYVFVIAYLSTTEDIAVNLEPKAADDGKYKASLTRPSFAGRRSSRK